MAVRQTTGLIGIAGRCPAHLRVPTDEQATENQRQALQEAAEVRGWQIVATYEEQGISGAKGHHRRPGLDRKLKDARHGRFDTVMAWAVDRMGRFPSVLIGILQEVHGAGVDLFLHQQAIDTTTPAGRAMFGMMGVFAEFERPMIQARVNAGLDRARKQGMRLGRSKLAATIVSRIQTKRAEGIPLRKIVFGCGAALPTVQGAVNNQPTGARESA